jgi:DNA topoisomerase-3
VAVRRLADYPGKPEFVNLFGGGKNISEPLGVCPRCGSFIREFPKGFFCDKSDCGFKLFKDSKFWTAKKKPLTAAIVNKLLKDGRVSLKNLYSEKTGKKYDANVILDDTGNGYVNFKIEF